MTMTRWFGLCAVATLIGAGEGAAQGLVWQTQMKGQQMGTQQMTTAYMPGMIAVSGMNANGDAMILRLDRRMLYFIKRETKKYDAVTFDEFEAGMKKMGAVVDAQMASALKEMEKLPAEQRALIEKQLGALMPKKEGGAITVERKEDRKSIAGYPAALSVATRNGENIVTAWTTTSVPGWNGMKKEFNAYMQKMSEISQFSKDFTETFKQIEGFPLELEMAGFTSTVTKVEAKATPASAFEVPAGYALEKTKLFE